MFEAGEPFLLAEGKRQSLAGLVFVPWLVAHAQLLAAFGTAGCQHLTAIFGCHSLAEPVFVSAFALRRLKRNRHERVV